MLIWKIVFVSAEKKGRDYKDSLAKYLVDNESELTTADPDLAQQVYDSDYKDHCSINESELEGYVLAEYEFDEEEIEGQIDDFDDYPELCEFIRIIDYPSFCE